MAKMITEKGEIDRLSRIYQGLPPNKLALAEGLIVQAARLRVRLDKLWRDIKKNGETELFSQSDKTEPYMKKRPEAELFTATDKNYQAIMKQLNDLVPPGRSESKLERLLMDE